MTTPEALAVDHHATGPCAPVTEACGSCGSRYRPILRSGRRRQRSMTVHGDRRTAAAELARPADATTSSPGDRRAATTMTFAELLDTWWGATTASSPRSASADSPSPTPPKSIELLATEVLPVVRRETFSRFCDNLAAVPAETAG